MPYRTGDSPTRWTLFCVTALEALARFGKPETFNTVAGPLEQAGIQISMDGRWRWMDNVSVERLRARSSTARCG